MIIFLTTESKVTNLHLSMIKVIPPDTLRDQSNRLLEYFIISFHKCMPMYFVTLIKKNTNVFWNVGGEGEKLKVLAKSLSIKRSGHVTT